MRKVVLCRDISAVLVEGLSGYVSGMMKLCEPGIIDKTRYLVRSGRHIFEVDEFYGENEGLVVAEVELASEDEAFVKPDFIGEEVTGDIRYYNSQLMKKPYKMW